MKAMRMDRAGGDPRGSGGRSVLVAGAALAALALAAAAGPAEATERTLLYASPSPIGEPTWSPDGQWIAFWKERENEARDPFVIPSNGGESQELTDLNGLIGSPAWSPDGGWIAFDYLGLGTDGQAIWKVKADGSTVVQVVDTEGCDLEPAWSPDGSTIAFVDVETFQLRLVSGDGGAWWPLLGQYALQNPSWSPEGQWIGFAAHPPGWPGAAGCLYRIRASGGDAEQLNCPRGLLSSIFEPVWSPDGAYFAFRSTSYPPFGVDAVYVWWIEGAIDNVTQLSDLTHRVADPAWSPDGRSIVYRNRTPWELWIARDFPFPGGPTHTEPSTWGRVRGRFRR